MIARTHTIDPARQFFSPYNWLGNNPNGSIDPDGAIGIPSGLFENIGKATSFFSSGRFEESATAHVQTKKFGNIPNDFLEVLQGLDFSADEVTQLLIEMRALEADGTSDNSREFVNSRFTFNVSDGSKFTTYDFVNGQVFVPGSDAAHANPTSGVLSIIRRFNSANSTQINGGDLVLDVVAHTHNVVSPGVTFGGTPSRNDRNYHINNNVRLSIIINTRNKMVFYFNQGGKKYQTINNARSIFK